MHEDAIAYVGLGANLGDRSETLVRALVILDEHPQIQVSAVSRAYETGPVGVLDQPDFLNAVARVQTGLTARELLDFLLDTEQRMGRKRIAKWGPRILDLDVLLYNSNIISEPGLTVPHPYMHLRGFVLRPLCDLAAEEKHPLIGVSYAALLSGVADDSVRCLPHLSLWAKCRG
ncbi:MAG: 2-amino-4-hydroxy-6-hydroxymethyldihydropteridine diphosphokinase [bacterium]|nr:2-amino-4-hydroxy-6-hydroxymethyldihydropteridine diphosphokinase [bacterium]